MSADNGVYILKTKDQYRVTSAQAIENIFDVNGKLKPIEVVWLWGKVRYTKDENKAQDIAKMINSRCHTEYGIKTFVFNKTWKHIVYDAKYIAECNLKYFDDLDTFEKEKAEYVLSITM